ncbi:MAG: PAS domain S-box protein [Chloroflexota bacterium]|nr:PAS domain S-box protein [Chloroflexota bacterium]MDQ5866087.1 PAS domain S-box protein [Chloroflexota bacterium]
MLFSSIASVRTKGGEKSRGTTTTRERQPNNGLATLVALFVRTRLLCAVLLLVVAGIGAVSPLFIPRESAAGTALTIVSLCLSLALGVALFIGAVVARRWTSALVNVLDDLSQGRYSPRSVPGTEAGEIGSLSRAVDTAASQIQGRLGRLEQTEAQFRSLLSCLPGVPYIYNACQDGEIEVLYVSPKIQELLGFTQVEWLNDPTLWSQQLHNDDRARVLAQYTAACERGETFACEYRILTKDGRTVWLRDEARITQNNEGSDGGDGNGQFMLGMLMDVTEQRRDRQHLHQRADRFAGIVDTAREAIISTDHMGTVTVFNQGAQTMLGYSEADVLGKNLAVLWPSDKAKGYARQLTDFAGTDNRTGKLGNLGEVLVCRKDGTHILAETSISQYGRGADKTITVVMRNITERRRIEEHLKSGEASFRAMFSENPLPMMVYDLDSLYILEVNSAAQARYGYSRNEFIAMRMTDLKAHEEMPRLVENGNGNKVNEGQYSIQIKHRCKDGRIMDVQLVSHGMEFAGHRAAMVVAEDITERKKAEEALRESEQRFRAMFEGAAIGTALVDLDGHYIKANPALERMLGYGSDELRNIRLADITHTDDLQRCVEPFTQLVGGHKDFYHIEQRFVCRDGSVTWANLTMSLVRGNRRKPQFVIAMVENITERKNTQEQVKRQLERLAALRNIDMTISSSLDLRVTLNVILEQVMSQLHVDATDVLLHNPHTQMLEYAAGRGFKYEGITRTRLRLGEGNAGRAALERRTINVPNLHLEQDPSREILLAGEEFVTYYAVPLLVKGQVKGVLEIFNRTHLNPQLEWRDFLEALTSQAAIAIDNATMFNDLQRSNTELALAYDTTLEGWSHALDLRDEETEGHTQRVTALTVRLARSMGVNETEIVQVQRGALLHDIGKMGIPDSILLKPGPLTEEEWEIMRRHPVYAYELLSPISFLRPALDIPYCHHEKWDGTGYPRGLKGEQIPLSARIFAVIDVYDALRSDRPYRKAWAEDKVRDHIQNLSGTHFDPRVVEAFMNMDELPHTPTEPLGGLWEYIERKLSEDDQLGESVLLPGVAMNVND